MASPPLRSTAQPRVLVLACGNTLRGDDGVGWQIGNALKRQLPASSLTILLTQQLLPEHAESLSTADIAIFVDSSVLIPPGQIAIDRIHPALKAPHLSTHHLDPASLLTLSLELYGKFPGRSIAVTVGSESFAWNEKLSERVKTALTNALDAIRSQIQQSAMSLCKNRMI